MSCLICNELLHHIITRGLISCVSHINTISPPKLLLNYQNQTTFTCHRKWIMTASILSFRCVLFLFFIQPGCPPLVCFCSLSTFYTDTLCSHAWTPIKSKAWQVSDTHRDACPRCTPVALAAGPPAARPSLFNDIYADCRHLREKKITWRTVYPKLRHAYMVWMMGVVGLHHPTLRQGEISSARTHANLVKL